MKKLVYVLIALFSFFLIACNEKQDNEKLDSKSVDNKINLENKHDFEETNQEHKGVFDKKTQDVEQDGDELKNEITNKEQEENIDEKTSIGKFYSLQEAFNNNFLTIDDLRIIANYHNNRNKMKMDINNEVLNEIKETAAYILKNDDSNPVSDAKASDFIIINYYGAYNGSFVFIINNPYFAYPAEDLDIYESVGDVVFHYTSQNKIVVWISNNS